MNLPQTPKLLIRQIATIKLIANNKIGNLKKVNSKTQKKNQITKDTR